MNNILAQLLPAIGICFLILFMMNRFKKYHIKFTGDSLDGGPQKIHSSPIPRIGGCGIFLGILGASFFITSQNNLLINLFILSTSPFFLIGLIEDLHSHISVKYRFLALFFSATLVVLVAGFRIEDLGFKYANALLATDLFATLFSAFAITGLINSFNIIDGLNGLCSFITLIIISSIFCISMVYSDIDLAGVCLISIGAIIGFLIWNYPAPKFFLGDSGAYLCGGLISLLSIALVSRNNQVSPWFLFSLNVYPIFETIFSIYRRTYNKNSHPGKADRAHLHSLIFKRLLSKRRLFSLGNFHNSNSISSGLIFIFYFFWSITCVAFHKNSMALIFLSIIFIFLYLYVYKNIINFKTRRLVFLS